jgi:uncharacterized membrane-anchored protein YitT (DUF2179 family)
LQHGLTGISQMLFRIFNPELNYLAFLGLLNIDLSYRRILLVKKNIKDGKPD